MFVLLHRMNKLMLLLLVIIVVTTNVAEAEVHNVNVSNAGKDSPNCTSCLTLQYALSTWENYTPASVGNDRYVVNFFIEVNENIITSNTSFFQVVVPKFSNFSIYGRGPATIISCSHGIIIA